MSGESRKQNRGRGQSPDGCDKRRADLLAATEPKAAPAPSVVDAAAVFASIRTIPAHAGYHKRSNIVKQKYEVAQAMQAKRERLAELFKGFPDVTLTADQASKANQLNGELKELGEKLDELSRLEAIALNNQRALDAGRAAPQDDRPAGRVRDADPNAGKSLGQRFAEHQAYIGTKGAPRRQFGIQK